MPRKGGICATIHKLFTLRKAPCRCKTGGLVINCSRSFPARTVRFAGKFAIVRNAAQAAGGRTAMKKCIHCGAEVPEEEAVCPACGQSVTEEAQTSENQQAQPETEKGPETDEDTCEEKIDPQEDGAQEPAAETPAAAAHARGAFRARAADRPGDGLCAARHGPL